ncbi:Superfamily I DNA or RNA helicase [Rhodococcus triatomae]|uniref:DNA 3'-5' helicase n=2 Tax=Rhodococcus triatomae TaxID=300028 RepID=A0A1G8F592_9NOCA|nr:ATP-dependent DNA helicase [Rhodococcus triatomae]SDH77169.1 Superfamily I DNA or RNA helicase [Rhodococcus triatomae]
MRLVRRQTRVQEPREWDPAALRVLEDTGAGGPRLGGGWRPWQVLGGPGTGKTALVVDSAVRRILAGADPESVLVLVHSRRAAVAVREQITAALTAGGAGRPRASREPLVRTVHSYAFAVLRLQAAAHGNPPPRLITGAEQDSAIREMLRGEIEDGAAEWPDRLRPALATLGFAAELRDLIMRAAERGLGPEDLSDLGRAEGREEWVAAGRFAARYEQATLLRATVGMHAPEATAPALDAAELVSAALEAFATDPELLRRERARVRHLLVDDAQHLDPQAAQLIRLVGTGADSAVVAGDPDQSVFAFRGADPSFLTGLAERHDERQVLLPRNHRAAAEIADATRRILGRLPGSGPQRAWEAGTSEGRVAIRVASSPAKEAAVVADTLRRAHLTDGIAWSRMAVVVRSVPASLAPLRRALLAAGVPVTTPADELPLARRHGVSALLLVLRAVTEREFTGDDALALLSGPIGGAEPVALRRLRRGLRRSELSGGGDRDSSEILRRIVLGADEPAMRGLTEVEAAPLQRVGKVLRRARKVLGDGGGVEDVLWAAWRAAGLEKRWAAASLRGGPVGAQADRDLDAVVALFDAAAGYVDRLPRAGIAGFLDHVEGQEIPTLSRTTPLFTESVTVLSAHAAVGREWDVVAVVGVQEGTWPSLRSRSSLLGTGELIDLVSGTVRSAGDTRLSRTAPLLAEERRLFLLACSRARRILSVTAVDAPGGDADLVRSRFVDELAVDGDTPDALPEPVTEPPARVLALPALVAELRAVVCDSAADQGRRDRAAVQLARLAEAGVRGAHPDQWYGLADPSTAEPLWGPEDGPVPLSPSTIEQLTTCPLRWLLERNGGTDGDNARAVAGTLVHTLVQALAGHIPPDHVDRALEEAWAAVDLGSPWYSRRELTRTRTMLETFAAWMRASRSELTEIGVEVAVDGVLEPRSDGDPQVRLRGRIDRLERDAEGRPVVVDVKTARTPVSRSQAEEHAQLAAYQVAAATGAVEGMPPARPGGARLVFVAKPHKKDGATERVQAPLSDADLERWIDAVHAAAAATRGPRFLAQVNDGCRHCPVRSSCPVHDEGRQVSAQ